MLSRWFNRSNRLTHSDPAQRLQAIQALSPEQADTAHATLLELARHDSDAAVRTAALEQIRNPDALQQLLREEQVAEVAAERIAAQIHGGQRCAAHDHPLVLAARIRKAGAADVDALLPLLQDAQQCAELALRLRDTARQQVLEHPLLNDEAGLTALLRAARGKDKTCHRHAKERLEQIKASRQACSEISQRISEIDASIHKALGNEPAEPQALLNHRQRLLKLQAMRVAAVEELNTTVQELAASGAETDEFPATPDPLADVDLNLPQPAENPFPPLVAGFAKLADDMRTGASVEDIGQQRERLTQNWLAHADRFPPSAAEHSVFEQVSKQFQAYHSAWQRLATIEGWQQHLPPALPDGYQLGANTDAEIKARTQWRKRWRKPLSNLQWPAAHTSPPTVNAALQAMSRIDDELERLNTLLQAAAQQLHETIEQAQQQLEEGHIENAKSKLRSARSLQKAGVKGGERELAAVSARVAEFRDWQQFATNPKRADLLDQVLHLAESPDADPANQANRLKHLRQQWRQLGKPASTKEFEQQQRFDELADTAFEPCRAYYAQQAELRAANLQQREMICEQLQSYLTNTDWDKADMQAAESILRQAREEWHKYHPCDRRALKPVQERFEDLQNDLHGKVKAAWDANLALKQNIVDDAKALLEGDLRSQIDGAKALQQRWRQIGSTPRGPDQRLWQEFRDICDHIFAQRDADQQARKAQLDAQYQSLEEAVAALEQAAGQADPSRKALAALNAGVDQAAAGLNVTPELRKRINAARSDYHAALETAAKQQAQLELASWREWDEQVSAAEQTGAAMDAPHPTFAPRLEGTAASADWLSLVLEAEIAADQPSPSADQTARMALQIELMNAGRRDLGAEDYRDLLRRWCAAGPKDETANALRERFFAAIARRL